MSVSVLLGMNGLVWAVVALLIAVASSSRSLIAWLQETLAVREPLRPDISTCDVVIVLGYALFRNGSLTQPLKGRVLHGVRAWEQAAPGTHLVFSGAHPGDGLRTRSEASAMLAYALEVHGTRERPQTWLLESESISTRTNALFSLDIMRQNGWTKALVVTNTFHQRRSLWTFEKAADDINMEFQVGMLPMPFVGHEGWGGGPWLNTLMDHVDYWRELAAVAWYRYKRFAACINLFVTRADGTGAPAQSHMAMEEEQHLERFDVDNDYEGGEFIGGEFFYRNKRQKRQQTEDDRIYGVFASGSDSDDDRPRRGRGSRGAADYSAPVAFVSKGTVSQNHDEAMAVKKEEPADEDDGGRPGLGGAGAGMGLGFGGAGGGLGFQGAPAAANRAEEDDEDKVLPTAFGARIKARAEQRRKADERQHKQEKQRKENTAVDPEFASFEKYSKGIGMKLLQKMGYKPGEGLGRDKGGIVKPIEVKIRAKNMGMGFGQRHAYEDADEDKKTAGPTQGPETAPAAAQGKMWKKKHAAQRVKREYKTATDVIESSAAKPVAAQPILDMRGPQVRVITNMEHLNAQEETAGGQQVPMPELQHNLQLLVDLAEADIQKIDNRLRHEQDSATLLGREKTRLEDETLQLEVQLKRMQLVLERVERCDAAVTNQPPATTQQSPQEPQPAQPLTLEEIRQVYDGLYKEFREEYVLYNLGTAALAHALPRFQALLSGWQPLQDPDRGAADFRKWRALLDPQDQSSNGSSQVASLDPGQQDPYTQLFCEAVLPPLRSACTQWQPRDPEPLLRWLETWETLSPHVAMVHVLDMLVMPALRRAVSDWEPRAETVPIHAWLHPWLPYLGLALEELYPVIRGKLAAALSMWQAQDGSALVLLRPWHKVFSPEDWSALMAQCIVPKLAAALATFVVNPAAQDMSVFNHVMAWADVMPPQHMAMLLDQGFFPKWHQVLHYWLSHNPNYDEVTRWYLGWKASFPPALLDQERIRRQFNAALDMMNSAVDGNVPTASAAGGPTGAYASRWATADAQESDHQPTQPPLPVSVTPAAEMTLKELVQRFAAENGIQFMPKFGRIQDGLQVYAFGNTSVILDNVNSSVRALINNRWAPVTLESLVMNNAKTK